MVQVGLVINAGVTERTLVVLLSQKIQTYGAGVVLSEIIPAEKRAEPFSQNRVAAGIQSAAAVLCHHTFGESSRGNSRTEKKTCVLAGIRIRAKHIAHFRKTLCSERFIQNLLAVGEGKAIGIQ